MTTVGVAGNAPKVGAVIRCDGKHACLDDALGCVVCNSPRNWAAHALAVKLDREILGGDSPYRPESKVEEKSPTILDEADRLTGNGGDRNDSYDHPHPNFSKIAAVWSPLFGVPVTPRMVAHAMILMKVVRDAHKAKRDNLVDIAGYARCAERLEEWK